MRKLLCFILSLTVLLAFSVESSYAKEPENLYIAKQAVIKYHDSGEYEYDIKKITQDAEKYLEKIVVEKKAVNQKLAIVLDIDDTALSNYQYEAALSFGGDKQDIDNMLSCGDSPAVREVLELYNLAKKNHVATFFVTGRREHLRRITIKNLTQAGFSGWNKLYLRPENDPSAANNSIMPFKTKIRKEITAQGYDIILNIGDQYSDLVGGYADHIVKLPNPYYYIP